MYYCTELVLPPGAHSRESPRPKNLQLPGYADAFDTSTLFYDVVAIPAPRSYLLFIGPPFLNLLSTFYWARLNGHQIATMRSSYYFRDRCCDVWIANWKDGDVTLDTEFGSFILSPQPASHHLYAGKRVLYTLSKDNEIAWIIDWVTFHAKNHGANAVLIYDNGSSRYTGEALEDALKAAFSGFEINVVHWPYKYGPQGFSATHGWDSDFCQAGAFQDARFRFLASASSVLNCDIDELVVSARRGVSVFDATENRASGCTMFHGKWISNAFPNLSIDIDLPSNRRHWQFIFMERGADQCPLKWCVVPSRCAMDDHWSVHSVIGKDMVSSYSRAFSYRHFRSISTNWKYQRHWQMPFDKHSHLFDSVLARSFARAGMYYRRPRQAGLWSSVGRFIIARLDWLRSRVESSSSN